MGFRIERDSMGEVNVPDNALYGAQTQRAVDNFGFSDRRMPAAFIRRLAAIKAAAAQANGELEVVDKDIANRIHESALSVVDGNHADQFPVNVFQTGSGTSTNMNMNEVLARLAGDAVHPNDHVNASQSSNDVIPSCIQVAAALEIEGSLLPALKSASQEIRAKAEKTETQVKTGRTHLMDAMPVTLAQELGTWAFQLDECADRFHAVLPRLKALPLGGTAVGTGVNCPPGFPEAAIGQLSRLTGTEFTPAANRFSRMAAQDVSAECSSCLRSLAVVLMKIANDLRWMSSGPLAGLAEIQLKPLQPGSSIMPGKVNPVVPEAVAMIAAEVMGNDVSVGICAQSGNFQLNVMLPLIAEKLLSGISLCSHACDGLGETIAQFEVLEDNLRSALGRNPILVTALNRHIGYESAAAIAKQAYAEGRPVMDVALENTDFSREELETILDPARLAHPERGD